MMFNSGRFVRGVNRAAQLSKRACERCGQLYQPNSFVQKYCGSARVRGTCAWQAPRERQKHLRKDPKTYPTRIERERDTLRERYYGVTPDFYKELECKQEGKCAICRRLPKEGEVLVVDHDHATREVRGLLCHQCNQGLGLFKDRPELLASAATYLQTTPRYALAARGREAGKGLGIGGNQRLQKLTAAEVRDIRVLAAEGMPQGRLAIQFGVSQSNIACIVNHMSWRKVV